MFNPKDWYWAVAGSTTQVYGSKRNIYVAVDDADYQAWRAKSGEDAAQIASETDIWYYLSSTLPAWLFDGTTFAQPAEGAWTTTQLHAYQMLTRYNTEQGGMTLASGMPILTDDRSQAKINGARLAAEKNSSLTTQWHAADGSFHAMTSTDVITMSDELQTHIDNCFTTSSTVAADIDAGTTTTLDQIDAAFAAVAKAARKK